MTMQQPIGLFQVHSVFLPHEPEKWRFGLRVANPNIVTFDMLGIYSFTDALNICICFNGSASVGWAQGNGHEEHGRGIQYSLIW